MRIRAITFHTTRRILQSITAAIMMTMIVVLPATTASAAVAVPTQPTPDDPTDFLPPNGANFALFAGLAPLTQLIIGVVLVVMFIVGIFLILKGLIKYRAARADEGRGSQGVGYMISGGVVLAASLLIVPLLQLILPFLSTIGSNI